MLSGISSGMMTSKSRTLGTICFCITRNWTGAQRLEQWLFAGSGRWGICVISLAIFLECITNYISFAVTACLACAVSILLQRQGVCYRSRDCFYSHFQGSFTTVHEMETLAVFVPCSHLQIFITWLLLQPLPLCPYLVMMHCILYPSVPSIFLLSICSSSH